MIRNFNANKSFEGSMTLMSHLYSLRKEDFENLPIYHGEVPELQFDSLVIIPTTELHDSGFGCIRVIGIIHDMPRYELTSWSDVLHFDGIGGYGKTDINEYKTRVQSGITVANGWSIDLLPCGYFRIFSHNKIEIGSCFSSFEFYGVPKNDK